MLGHSQNVRVLEVGAYDIDGTSWPWIDLYDPEAREKVLRMSVDPEVALDGVTFGDVVDLAYEVSNETKVLKGTDRTYVRHNCRVQQIAKAARSNNGRTEPAPQKAAA
jgi:hypothetical protein